MYYPHVVDAGSSDDLALLFGFLVGSTAENIHCRTVISCLAVIGLPSLELAENLSAAALMVSRAEGEITFFYLKPIFLIGWTPQIFC